MLWYITIWKTTAVQQPTNSHDLTVNIGGVRPQGWSCVAHTRKAEDKKSGQMYFTFQSPVKTSYRSLAEALKACGLVSTNKRRCSSDGGGAPTVCTMPDNAHAQGSPEAPIPPPKRSKTSKRSKPKQVGLYHLVRCTQTVYIEG